MILKKFLRNPSSGNYIREIDSLRFFAIIPVVLLHLNTSFFRIFESNDYSPLKFSILNYGGWGVELFFAISGFVICLPFFKSLKSSNKIVLNVSYFFKRFRRIEPPFFISLLIIYSVLLFSETLNFNDSFFNFLATFFYSHKILYGEWSNINPVTWSLETEIQFYIIIPFIFIFFQRLNVKQLKFLIFITFFCSLFFDHFNLLNQYLNLSVLNFAHLFMIGIFFSYIYTNYNFFFEKKNILFDLLFVISFVGIYLSKVFNVFLLFDFSILILFISIFKATFLRSFFCKDIFVVIGGMCYSIYLLHYAIIHVLGTTFNFFSFESYLLTNFLIFTILIFISALFYLYVEKPFMNKKNR